MKKIPAELARANQFYAWEINNAASRCLVDGHTMPPVKESREGYVVFTEHGDCLYDGFNQTVARLVAASCSLPVY